MEWLHWCLSFDDGCRGSVADKIVWAQMGVAEIGRKAARVSVLSRYIIKEILKGSLVAILVLWTLMSPVYFNG